MIPYLKLLNISHRSDLAKFRCGVAPIRIESWHYEQLALNDRKCILCQADSIESEEHVMLKCDAYADIRDDPFAHISTIHPHFNNLSDNNKLSVILSSHLTTAQSALTCHNILQRRRNLMYRWQFYPLLFIYLFIFICGLPMLTFMMVCPCLHSWLFAHAYIHDVLPMLTFMMVCPCLHLKILDAVRLQSCIVFTIEASLIKNLTLIYTCISLYIACCKMSTTPLSVPSDCA